MGDATRQIVLVGDNDLCRLCLKDTYKTKKGVIRKGYTFFESTLKSVYFIPSSP